jgi:hypothetical protein
MYLDSFYKLLTLLYVYIAPDKLFSRDSTTGNGSIYPELVVAMSLHYIGEGMSSKGLADTFELSVSLSRYLVKKIINAVL